MNQKPSQLRLVLIWSHVVASRICCLATRGWSAMSAIGDVPSTFWFEHDLFGTAGSYSSGSCSVVGAGGGRPPPAPVRSAIDSLQLPFGFRHGGLGVLGAGAVVGEHVDHDEVCNRGCRLFAGRADSRGRQRALA